MSILFWMVFIMLDLWDLISSPDEGDCPKACFCHGIKHLHSPLLPWKEVFSRISICVSFFYRLQSNGSSKLDVYDDLNRHIWSIQGNQGNSWRKASIPIEVKQAFKVCAVNGNEFLVVSFKFSLQDLLTAGMTCCWKYRSQKLHRKTNRFWWKNEAMKIKQSKTK